MLNRFGATIFSLGLIVFPLFSRAENTISFAQKWCIDGTFQFVVEGSFPSLSAPYETCFTLSSDEMYSAPLQTNQKMNRPVGNFVDYLVKNILKRSDLSHKNIPLSGKRKYLVTAGSCLSNQFFTVQMSFLSLPAKYVNPARDQCRFEQSYEIASDLPLSGVYPRANGQTVQDFISELLK